MIPGQRNANQWTTEGSAGPRAASATATSGQKAMGATGGVMHRRLDGGSDGGESPAVGGGDEEGRGNGRGQIPVLGISFDLMFGWGSRDPPLLSDGGSPRDQGERVGEDDWQGKDCKIPTS